MVPVYENRRFPPLRDASAVYGRRAKRTDLDRPEISGMCPDGPKPSSIRSPNRYILWSAVSRLEAALVSASGTTRLKTRAGINGRKRWSRCGDTGRSKEKPGAVHSRTGRRSARSAPCATWAGSTITVSGRRASPTIDLPSACAKRPSVRADGSRRLEPFGWAAASRHTCPISALARARRSIRLKRSSRQSRCPASAPNRRSAGIAALSTFCIRLPIPPYLTNRKPIAAPTKSRSRPSATTHRARTISIAWKPKFSSAFPDSARASD